MVASHGIIIKKYHAENENFRANAWVQNYQERANPKITTYDGVDAHHSNGLAGRCIRDIQDNVRSMMIHAQQKWPETITAHLWPYALKHTNNAHNDTPLLAHPQGFSPLQIFTVTQV